MQLLRLDQYAQSFLLSVCRLSQLSRIFHKTAQTSCKSLIEWCVCRIHSVKSTRGLLMRYSPPGQLCCPPIPGDTVRAECDGGALSSDFGALLLRGMDHQ